MSVNRPINAPISDLGLDKREYDTLVRTLPKLHSIPSKELPSDTDLTSIVGVMEMIVESQEQFARVRTQGRRRFLTTTISLSDLIGTAGLGYYKWEDLLSLMERFHAYQELQAQKEAERQEQLRRISQELAEQKKIEELQHAQYLEREKQLGSGTVLSYKRYRARHPLFDPRLAYILIEGSEDYFEIESGKEIILSERSASNKVESYFTGITIHDFQRPSDGTFVPKLIVKKEEKTANDDEWILRNKTDHYDANILGIDYLGENRTSSSYYNINRATTRSSVIFQFSSRKRGLISGR